VTGNHWQQSPAARLPTSVAQQSATTARDPVPGSSSPASVCAFTTDPQRLWDFVERTGVVTRPLDRE